MVTFDDDVMCNILNIKWNKKEHFNDNCQMDEADQDILNRLQLINNINHIQSAKENIFYLILGNIILKIFKKNLIVILLQKLFLKKHQTIIIVHQHVVNL